MGIAAPIGMLLGYWLFLHSLQSQGQLNRLCDEAVAEQSNILLWLRMSGKALFAEVRVRQKLTNQVWDVYPYVPVPCVKPMLSQGHGSNAIAHTQP